jgi:chromate reductase
VKDVRAISAAPLPGDAMNPLPLPVAVVVGSLRRDSLNRKLATAIIRLAPPELSFHLVDIASLPPYNQDDDAHPAPSVVRLKAEIAKAGALLFVTPEYNRSIPGVLKNAIDHASRPYGHSAWTGKPAGIIGVSPGPQGTSMAQQHLRNVLACLDVPTLGQPEAFVQSWEGLFDGNGDLDATNRDRLQAWMDRFAAFAKRNAPLAHRESAAAILTPA